MAMLPSFDWISDDINRQVCLKIHKPSFTDSHPVLIVSMITSINVIGHSFLKYYKYIYIKKTVRPFCKRKSKNIKKIKNSFASIGVESENLKTVSFFNS